MFSETLSENGPGYVQHFSHPWSTSRAFVTDYDEVAFFYGPLLKRIHDVFFAVKNTRRTAPARSIFVTGNFQDRPVRREIPM